MKKIINGAKYDTTTAKSLGAWSNNYSARDFKHCSEELFRTKSGKYFLYGHGGAMTQYAVSNGDNTWSGGSQIITMSRKAAMEWAEEHLDADEYEEAFGEVTEDSSEQMCITISAALKGKLWKMAEQQKISISALIEEVLKKAMEDSK